MELQSPSNPICCSSQASIFQPITILCHKKPLGSITELWHGFKFKLLSSDKSSSDALHLSCLSWNIEGFSRNIHSLKHYNKNYKPSLIFLSEPQLFQCDAKSLLKTLQGEYSSYLNSEDLYHPDLALERCKAKGGTMLLWETSLDPYISIVPSDSPAILPMVLQLPHHSISCHVVIYLPTSGQEAEFVAALASLDACLNDIYLKYENCPIFIRGDANVNPNNVSRPPYFVIFLTSTIFSVLTFITLPTTTSLAMVPLTLHWMSSYTKIFLLSLKISSLSYASLTTPSLIPTMIS